MELSMVYMASGFGRRFGSNKLLMPLEGKPLYLHGLGALKAAAELLETDGKGNFAAGETVPKASQIPIHCRIFVVSQYEEILKEAEKMGFETVYNPYSSEGITASLRLGTRASGPDTDAFLYFVADQPYMQAKTIASFASGFFSSGKGIGCVCSRGRPGSPNLFHSRFYKELLSLEGDKGGRQIMGKYPEELWKKEVNERELVDIDTLNDIIHPTNMESDGDRSDGSPRTKE